MDLKRAAFVKTLRDLADRQRRLLTSHPTPQELAAYHAGELPPQAEAGILDHLAICRECSDLLLDLFGFADLKPPAGVPELTDAQVEQDWQALRKRMGHGEGKKERAAEVVPIRPVGPAQRSERTYSPLLPTAASILAVLGFSYGLYQSARVERLSQLRVVSVIYGGQIERGGPSPLRISSSSGGVVYLFPDPESSYSAYQAEIVRGEEVLSRIPVRLIDSEELPLLIPPESLEHGDYHVRLYGLREGRWELSSDLAFEVNDN